jgi:RNA polymerase sigma factor (sigma-70 family)
VMTASEQLAVVDNLGLVYGLVCRVRGIHEADREDLVGAACLAFCRAVESWDPRRSPLTRWAWRSIRYAILDELRRLARRLAPLPSDVPAPTAESPYERVTRYLAACTRLQRKIVVLRYGLSGGRGLGIPGVAQRLGRDPRDVGLEFWQAMAAMRKEADDDPRSS